jgi:hypothetical protein
MWPERRAPREQVRDALRLDASPPDGDEGFFGYGMMGLPLSSGHVLAMRSFPASNIGPGYAAVWHRQPDGGWRFYADAPPQQSCARFFGAALEAAEVRAIGIEWSGPWQLRITVPEEQLDWQLDLEETPATRALNALGAWIPDRWWWNRPLLRTMGALAGRVLGLGHVRLEGRAPNGQLYRAAPRVLWSVRASQVVWRGTDLGVPCPLVPQARLGDFWVPQRGLLALGGARFEPFDAGRHAAASTRGATQPPAGDPTR